MSRSESARDAHSLERLVFFSDAVFAIAITLLVLEIDVPHLPEGANTADFGSALYRLLPSFFAFSLSFLVIGRFWIGHHDLFGQITRYSGQLLFPNLLYLMAIAFMPFATAFMGANLGKFVPSLLYNCTLFVTAVLDWNVTRVGYKSHVMADTAVRSDYARSAVLIGATLLSVAFTWISPQYSQLGMLLVPVGFRILARRERAGS